MNNLWRNWYNILTKKYSANDLNLINKNISLLNGRFQGAIQFLKSTRLKQHSEKNLGNLPWYLVLGAPGSGKTTLLSRTDLKFILSKSNFEKNTRTRATEHCDWWVTREAVLLDTPGYYAVHQSHTIYQLALWQYFLKLLKKYRAKRAISGIILVININDLANSKRYKNIRLAQALRQSLLEVNQFLNNQFPIYVIFTHIDKVKGFCEFFSEMSSVERQQPWGMTLSSAGIRAKLQISHLFNDEFEQLIKRIQQRIITRLHHEHTVERCGKIINFIFQFRKQKQLLTPFLRELFDNNHYLKAQLRGIYFTSSIQSSKESTKILEHSTSHALQKKIISKTNFAPKNFFVNSLFKRIIFHESSLNTRLPSRKLLSKGIRQILVILMLIMALTFMGYCAISFDKIFISINNAHTTIDQLNILNSITSSGNIDYILTRLNLLNKLNSEAKKIKLPWVIKYLNQPQVNTSLIAENSYRDLLSTEFLSSLVKILEQEIANKDINDSSFWTDAVANYMMLAEPINLQPKSIETWFSQYWQKTYAKRPIMQQELNYYIKEMFAHPFKAINVNPEIVEMAADVLANNNHSISMHAISSNKLLDSLSPILPLTDVETSSRSNLSVLSSPKIESYPSSAANSRQVPLSIENKSSSENTTIQEPDSKYGSITVIPSEDN